MRKILLKHAVFIWVISLLVNSQAFAEGVPQLVNYQSILTDVTGKPVPNGKYEVTFTLYDAATGGNILWQEHWDKTTTPIRTVKGNFSVMLGSFTGAVNNVFHNNAKTYLAIKVGDDAETFPRRIIASVAYAVHAENGVPQGAIIMWSGAVDNIPDGWSLCNGDNGTPDLQDRFIVGAGGAYLSGDLGGSASLSIASHTHSIAAESPGTSAVGDHTHHIDANITECIGDCNDGADDGSKLVGSDTHNHHFSTDTWGSGGHSHTVNAHAHGGATGDGGGNTLDNRPPYYALAFIMKL